MAKAESETAGSDVIGQSVMELFEKLAKRLTAEQRVYKRRDFCRRGPKRQGRREIGANACGEDRKCRCRWTWKQAAVVTAQIGCDPQVRLALELIALSQPLKLDATPNVPVDVRKKNPVWDHSSAVISVQQRITAANLPPSRLEFLANAERRTSEE